MSAQILDLAGLSGRSSGRSNECHPLGAQQRGQLAEQRFTDRFEFWLGASKKHYVHTIYELLDCPELPQVNYMLVRREADGRCAILQIGQTHSRWGSENLADIRHKAATLGANEVHIHLLPKTDATRSLVEMDLRAGQFGTLSAEPVGSDVGSPLH